MPAKPVYTRADELRAQIRERQERLTECQSKTRGLQAELDTLVAEQRELRFAAFVKVLNTTVIDALAPEHGPSSCSDKNPSNNYEFRCVRCYLLTVTEHDEPFEIHTTLAGG